MANQDEMSATFAVYGAMQADLLHVLVMRGVLAPEDGEAIVRRAQSLLSEAPSQGNLTAAAQEGLEQLAEQIASIGSR